MSMWLDILSVLGLTFFVCLYLSRSELLRVDWGAVSKFLALAFLVFCIRMTMPIEGSGPISVQTQLFVFWEDVIFGISIYYLKDHLKVRKFLWVSFAIFSSVLFAYYHLHYGLAWALITLVYPYFLSYRYGAKHGFGTVMFCHIYFDFISSISTALSAFLYKNGILVF